MKRINPEKIAVYLQDSDPVEIGEVIELKLGSVYQKFQIVNIEKDVVFVEQNSASIIASAREWEAIEENERLEIVAAINKEISPCGGNCTEIDWEDPQEEGDLMPVTAYTTGFDIAQDCYKEVWIALSKLGYDVTFDNELL